MLSEDAMRAMIRTAVAQIGVEKAATRWGITQGDLLGILDDRLAPLPQVIEALGYRRVTMYLDHYAPMPYTAYGH